MSSRGGVSSLTGGKIVGAMAEFCEREGASEERM
jgi:hypothetical protein